MPDYEKLYHLLFNAITDAVECLKREEQKAARLLLIRAQQQAEELYMLAEERPAKKTKKHP